MKKIWWLFALIVVCNNLFAQPFNNEWIDYNKTYYKFKVGATGLYRINQSTLANAGLASVSAEQFQLWRNGVQVPIFTSIATGQLSATDFIEFWGEMNDGKLDKYLYKDTANQLSNKLSLQTDTAAFFLTTNPTISNNLRYTSVANNVAGNTLTAEPFFNHTIRYNFKEQANRGLAVNVGEDVYSSTYDVAEFLSTKDISLASGAYKILLKNLYIYGAGLAATLNTGLAGSSAFSRNITVNINGTNFINKAFNGYSASINSSAIPISTFNGINDTASINIVTTNAYDRVVASFLEIQYPRQFNFGGNSSFEFKLPSSVNGNYLEVSNFNNATTEPPILYDATNLNYYFGDISVNGLVRFVLPASNNARSFVLVSRSASNINTVLNLQTRNFVNLSNTTNQGDYLIISHKALMSGTNAVEQYRQYRNSLAGGNYNAKIYDIDELVDQFAYGTKKHPLSIRNFLRFTKSAFTIQPKLVFFVGKGVSYDQYRFRESTADIESQNLIPTFGWPASDAMLVSPDNTQPAPMLPFGRLSAITQQEVLGYLDKVRQFEQQATNTTQTIANKAWMKHLIHVAGGQNDGEDNLFRYYLSNYERIISDTSFGGIVKNFNKTVGSETSPVTQADMQNAFLNGASLLTYFGHSAASGLAYNLNDPADYNNVGKYPVFLANGCTAGNIYDYDATRTTNLTNISERWVLAQNKGSIGFIAMTHFGLTSYLDYYSVGFYNSLARTGYNKTIGENMMAGLAQLKTNTSNFSDFFGKTHGEQFALHGDPAVKIYAFDKPDFTIEDPQVSVTPNFISILNTSFTFKANLYNLGKAIGDSVSVLVTRKYPNGSTENIFNQRIVSVKFEDSITLTIPIVPLRDKGNNSITITIDSDNKYDEISEANNSITKSFVIYEDALNPVYPYNYAIVNKQQIKLVASTANPLMPLKNYVMELDTTTFFNSSFKISKIISSVGGLLEFDPEISFVDSTVYYWRVAAIPNTGTYHWNNSSFVYLQNAIKEGYNQSHFFQHNESVLTNLVADTANRKFVFPVQNQTFTIRNGVWPYNGSDDGNYSIAINDAINPQTLGICWRGQNITYTVYDPSSLNATYNNAIGASSGQYGSLYYPSSCNPGKEYDFAFNTSTSSDRKSAMDFMDNIIPNGSYVVVRSVILDDPTWPTPTYANDWKLDTSIYGAGNSLYNRLKTAGFADIDSFNRMRAFAFVYQKNNNTFTPVWQFTQGKTDMFTMIANVKTRPNNGSVVSPKFGPVSKWYNMLWTGNRNDLADMVNVKLLGIKNNASVDTLQTFTELQINNDISTIDAAIYPYLKLYIQVKDSVNLSAYQLKYWRLLADLLPEGGLAPNIKYAFTDTLQKGQPQNIFFTFKNISDVAYSDSLDVKLQVTNSSNVTQTFAVPKFKKLLPGDTTSVSLQIATENLVGNNNFYININPANSPKEQTLTNNFAYRNFYVIGDNKNPILDVTFDGVHILNGDIVSSKPHIRMALKDESKFLALNDTSLMTVQLQKMSDGSIRSYQYGTDTLQFIPANLASGNNTAYVQFNPALFEDGSYQLIVKAKDRSNNLAGPQQYQVLFAINNTPMISNMFNYPNPFTTSTAFVFTLTGSVIPNNIKIQILTITGKIVREITKNELGNLHIGRNITDYRWDGTDMYGQKLANGVYLYHVVTTLDGKGLDKFQTVDASGNQVDTDKYFKAGYGKMYLMR